MSDDLQALRAIARELAERANSDPTFKEQIQKDPVKTLTAAGLPEKAVPDFLREAGVVDVSGYSPQVCGLTCFFLSM